MTTWASRGRTGVLARTAQRFEGPATQDVLRRLKHLHVVNIVTMFGAMFLFSALPFFVLISSFANRRVEDDLSQHLGLNAEASRQVEALFQASSAHSTSAIVLALLLTGAGTLGVASCVQAIYEQVFGQVRHGPGNISRLLLWIAGLCGWFALDSLIATTTHPWPGHVVLDGVLVLLVTMVFFGWSMHLLLGGRIPWHSLLRPAVVTAALWIGLQIFAANYFSVTVISDSRLYGSV